MIEWCFDFVLWLQILADPGPFWDVTRFEGKKEEGKKSMRCQVVRMRKIEGGMGRGDEDDGEVTG